jgi:diadenosine tetraphosphate (Ap4A) HIT family hydrolase
MRASEQPVPGGVIAETGHWRADHCLGSFGVGAVVVKTKEHLGDFWRLPDGVAAELGPFAQRIAAAIVDGLGAERVYMTMWVDAPPHHVHLVLYPRYAGDGRRALELQLALEADGPPDLEEAARAAETLRRTLQATSA